jgi:predicted XRE-type DNA-binding protein
MSPQDKPLAWLHGEVRTPPFTAAARVEAGVLLRLLQEVAADTRCGHRSVQDALEALRQSLTFEEGSMRKQERLEAAGWKVGTATEFLGLSAEEAAIVAVRAGLAKLLREMRIDRALTQAQLARLIRSSQSRVAKMEAGDSSVSIDLLVRTLVASGTSGATIGRAFADIDVRRKVRRSA